MRLQGSGVNQLACTGVKIDPKGPSLPVYDPTTASPPFQLVSNVIPFCQAFCKVKECNPSPKVANACEYNTAYGGGDFVSGRIYSTIMNFSSSLAPSTSSRGISEFYLGKS
jgi:hypothetical protein